MNAARTQPPVKYHVQIHPVREVALHGSADLAFWVEKLRPEGLHPARRAGMAQVALTGVDMRFLGIRFQELSIVVFVSRQEGGETRDGAFLVQAFNSVRLFAFVERAFFSTPYHHAAINVHSGLPGSIQVSRGANVLLRAAMPTELELKRTRLRSGEESWAGPIFLPGGDGVKAEDRKLFFGKLAGPTEAYPFLAEDAVLLKPSPDEPVLQWLADSNFIGVEWTLREAGTHGKSKTVQRGAVPGFTKDTGKG